MQFNFNFDAFTPGRRVKFVAKYNPEIRYGETGTIVPHPWGVGIGSVAVDWDKKRIGRHDCGGTARKGHGWCVSERDIEIIL